MSTLSALGSRQFQAPALAADSRPADGKTSGGAAPALSGQSALDTLSLSKSGIDLSIQGMSDRTDELGNATIDVAQNFMTSFAQNLFGDAAKGATLSFDAASVSAESSFAALGRHSEGPNGVRDGAAFSLNESSHFIGKGTLTTADGQTFDFEIEVNYESSVKAAATRAIGADAPHQPAHGPDNGAALPTAQLRHTKFPGGLGDLFKLLGRQLQGDLTAAGKAGANADTEQAGTLSVRLLKLIKHTIPLDSQATPAEQRAKAVADAYGVPAPADAADAPQAAADANAAKAADAAPAPAPETPAGEPDTGSAGAAAPALGREYPDAQTSTANSR